MTGHTIALHAGDGHQLSAYEARPERAPRGGLVLLQEIFGVTAHIRRVCDDFAAHGYRLRDRWAVEDLDLLIPFYPERFIKQFAGFVFEQA